MTFVNQTANGTLKKKKKKLGLPKGFIDMQNVEFIRQCALTHILFFSQTGFFKCHLSAQT